MAGRTRGGSPQRCPSCGAPTLTQWVGDTAALQAVVDLPPADETRPYAPAAAQATPHDLVWCLPRLPYRALRLRWTSGRHPPNCPHQHLLTHRCPPAEPTTIF
ncbi:MULTISPECIES: hypothetical protein [unclassified Streptomyces]|uniref:hypothetical protein n=1 Tax=unclassified Streptomyces TaxID=2593676 RepID=UPI00148966AA|nr:MULTISPECIES: hypothetical protein [unclassified Streptomyces]